MGLAPRSPRHEGGNTHLSKNTLSPNGHGTHTIRHSFLMSDHWVAFLFWGPWGSSVELRCCGCLGVLQSHLATGRQQMHRCANSWRASPHLHPHPRHRPHSHSHHYLERNTRAFTVTVLHTHRATTSDNARDDIPQLHEVTSEFPHSGLGAETLVCVCREGWRERQRKVPRGSD